MGKQTADTQEVTTADVGKVPAVPVDTSQELAAFKAHADSLTAEDTGDVQERILRSLLAATTPGDILRAGQAMPASELFDVPLSIETIRASESEYEDGADLYLHVDAVILSNGDRVTFSCGARDAVMKLVRLDQLSMLPIKAVIRQAKKPTKEGYFPVFLLPIDEKGDPF